MDVGILPLQLLLFLLVLLRQIAVVAVLILAHEVLQLEGRYFEALPPYFAEMLFGQRKLLLVTRLLDAADGALVDTQMQLRGGQLGDVGGE